MVALLLRSTQENNKKPHTQKWCRMSGGGGENWEMGDNMRKDRNLNAWPTDRAPGAIWEKKWKRGLSDKGDPASKPGGDRCPHIALSWREVWALIRTKTPCWYLICSHTLRWGLGSPSMHCGAVSYHDCYTFIHTAQRLHFNSTSALSKEQPHTLYTFQSRLR